MAIPEDAFVIAYSMDPEDIVDFTINMTDFTDAIFQDGEVVDTFSLVVGAEGAALGVTLGTGSYLAAKVNADTGIRFWPMVDSGYWDDPAWDDSGTLIPIEATMSTNSSPPRQFQRTLVIRTKQL